MSFIFSARLSYCISHVATNEGDGLNFIIMILIFAKKRGTLGSFANFFKLFKFVTSEQTDSYIQLTWRVYFIEGHYLRGQEQAKVTVDSCSIKKHCPASQVKNNLDGRKLLRRCYSAGSVSLT